MSTLEQYHPLLSAKYMDSDFAVKRPDHPLNISDLVVQQVIMASLKDSKRGLTHGRGLSESVRQQWVYSLHMFAAVYDAMSALTGRRKQTSQQHVELGKCRSKRDLHDLEVIIAWLEQQTV
ncbi:hypothetical protein SNE40_017884 [Patella caerulea]|uniref:Uncharacterized protein n=1 Tax=Patella caerulea TaxID=87958 RepID=A0AAN8JFR1_PATCE